MDLDIDSPIGMSAYCSTCAVLPLRVLQKGQLDFSCSELRSVPDFCEHGNEPSGSINAESFHELQREFYPLRSGGFCSPRTGQAYEPLYRTLIGVRLGLVMVPHRSGTPPAA